jgi:starvation-inducible DNA-binding protein
MNMDIGITENNLQAVANSLQQLLADEYVLYTKTRNYHWNIEGKNFMELHKFYQTQYEELDEIIDNVAERIRQMGHYAQGQLKDFIQVARLGETGYTNNEDEQLKNLLEDHSSVIRNCRKNAEEFTEKHHDLGTADFVTGIMEQHEKMAWFIRSYLK